MADPIPSTIPIRALEEHGDCVIAVAVFSHKDTLTSSCNERMVTASYDGMLSLWDLKTGVVLKKMEGHKSRVRALAASPDGLLIASGDESGGLIVWRGKTGECVQVITAIDKAHDGWIFSLDFSRDSRALVSGSSDATTKMWSTWNWQQSHSVVVELSTAFGFRHMPNTIKPHLLLPQTTTSKFTRTIAIMNTVITIIYHSPLT